MPEEEPAEEGLVVEEKDEGEEKPLTAEQFSTALGELVTRARAAGLRPVQMMISAYVKQGMSAIDGLLGSLEGGKKRD